MANWKKTMLAAAGGANYWVLEDNWPQSGGGLLDATLIYTDTDSNGNFILGWRGYPASDQPNRDPSGLGYYGSHAGIMKVASDGTIMWHRAIGESSAGYPMGLNVDSNDDIHILMKGDAYTTTAGQQASIMHRLSGSTGARQDTYLLNLGSNYSGWFLYASMAFGTINGTDSIAVNTRTKLYTHYSKTGTSVCTFDANPYSNSSEVAKFISQPSQAHTSQLKSFLFTNNAGDDIFVCPYKNIYGSGEIYFYHQDATNLCQPTTRYAPAWAMPSNTSLVNTPGYWGGAYMKDSKDTCWLFEQVGGSANPGYFLFGAYDFTKLGASGNVKNLGKPWKIVVSGSDQPYNNWIVGDTADSDDNGNLYTLIFLNNTTTSKKTALLTKMSNMTQATFNTSTGPTLEWALQIKVADDSENVSVKNISVDVNGDIFLLAYDQSQKEPAIIKLPPDGSITGNIGNKYELVDKTSSVSFSQWSAVNIYSSVNVSSNGTDHQNGAPDSRTPLVDVDYSTAPGFNWSLTNV